MVKAIVDRHLLSATGEMTEINSEAPIYVISGKADAFSLSR